MLHNRLKTVRSIVFARFCIDTVASDIQNSILFHAIRRAQNLVVNIPSFYAQCFFCIKTRPRVRRFETGQIQQTFINNCQRVSHCFAVHFAYIDRKSLLRFYTFGHIDPRFEARLSVFNIYRHNTVLAHRQIVFDLSMRLYHRHVSINCWRHFGSRFELDFVRSSLRISPKMLQNFCSIFNRHQTATYLRSRHFERHFFAYLILFFIRFERQQRRRRTRLCANICIFFVAVFIIWHTRIEKIACAVTAIWVYGANKIPAPLRRFYDPNRFAFFVRFYRCRFLTSEVCIGVKTAYIVIVAVPPPTPIYFVQTDRKIDIFSRISVFIQGNEANCSVFVEVRTRFALVILRHLNANIYIIRIIYHVEIIYAKIAAALHHSNIKIGFYFAWCFTFYIQFQGNICMTVLIQSGIKKRLRFADKTPNRVVKFVISKTLKFRFGIDQLNIYFCSKTRSSGPSEPIRLQISDQIQVACCQYFFTKIQFQFQTVWFYRFDFYFFCKNCTA